MVDLVHALPQPPQQGLAPGQALEGGSLGRREVLLHEEVTVLKEVCDLLGDPSAAAQQRLASGGDPSAGQLRGRAAQVLANLGRGMQGLTNYILHDVEAAELVGHWPEDSGQWARDTARSHRC
jgi:hypothetical protein